MTNTNPSRRGFIASVVGMIVAPFVFASTLERTKAASRPVGRSAVEKGASHRVVTTYSYDAAGRLICVRDCGIGNTSTYVYDGGSVHRK